LLGAIRSTHPSTPSTESVPEPLLQVLVLKPGSNLEQLHAIRKSRCLRRRSRKLLLRSRLFPRTAKPGPDARRLSAPRAHQPGICKDFVDFLKILLGLRWGGGSGGFGPRHSFDCSGGISSADERMGPLSSGPAREAYKEGGSWRGREMGSVTDPQRK